MFNFFKKKSERDNICELGDVCVVLKKHLNEHKKQEEEDKKKRIEYYNSMSQEYKNWIKRRIIEKLPDHSMIEEEIKISGEKKRIIFVIREHMDKTPYHITFTKDTVEDMIKNVVFKWGNISWSLFLKNVDIKVYSVDSFTENKGEK